MDSKYVNGVNQAGKVQRDDQVKPRFQKRQAGPMVQMFTNILNGFANICCPIKEEKKK
jgi:hypothetical protein